MVTEPLILADSEGAEVRVIAEDFDLEIGGGTKNDFKVTIPHVKWRRDIRDGCRLYIPGGEYGGTIGEIRSSTRTREVSVYGYTWRGLLDRVVIEPPVGQDYRVLSGDLSEIVSQVISLKCGTLFRAKNTPTGVSATWRFARYVSVLDGLSAMLAASGHKLVLRYIQTQAAGYVEVSAEPVVTRPDEFSVDGDVTYVSSLNRRGVNHLVCLGPGELKNREVLHLYVQNDGTIGDTQAYFGDALAEAVYDNNGLSGDELRDAGTDRLLKLANKDSFEASIDGKTQDDLLIGDVVTGVDYITGKRIAKPVVSKIVKRIGGSTTIEFRLEGEEL